MTKVLPDIFQQAAEKYCARPSFLTRNIRSKPYEGPSWHTLYNMGLDLATALADLGLNPKQHVAVLADNRLEWILSDYAILMNGAVSVPRATNITDDEIKYIINHSEAIFVIVEHEKMLDRVLKLQQHLPNVTQFIVMEHDYKTCDAAWNLYSLLEKGKIRRQAEAKNLILERMQNISPDDMFTIIYTSGTTGTPKGVMLSHRNMIYVVHTTAKLASISELDSAVSILPIWHVFERATEYLFIYAGAATYYSNIRSFANDMQDVKPTLMASAPRLWESIYDKVLARVKSSSPVRQRLFQFALFSCAQVNEAYRFFQSTQLLITKPSPLDIVLQGARLSLTWLVFILPSLALSFIPAKLREGTGGNLRQSVSAGGALPTHIDLFFNNIGIPLIEAYGMTECCPAIAMRTVEQNVIGSVGSPVPGCVVEIRNLNDFAMTMTKGQSGIVAVKGPQVMNGYFKNDEETAKVLKDGWMNTGDIGFISHNNNLVITGRSKETIVLRSGENVEPVPIENALLRSPYISQTMVVGQDQKHLSALIILHENDVRNWAETNSIADTQAEKLYTNERVNELIKADIRTFVSAKTGFKAHEKINNFKIIAKPFEIDDELTKLFKIKRHVVMEKYHDLIVLLGAG